MTPAAFDRCRAAGGKIRTKTLSGGKYMRVCIPKGGGKGSSVGGEVKTKKDGHKGRALMKR